MFLKNYITFLLTAVVFLTGSVAAFAQTSPVSGRVEVKTESGTTPVQGALVEVFRTDIKAKFPSAKTDKRGNFSFAGLPLGATFILAISGPNIRPEIVPNVRPGRTDLLITVAPGDGKRYTEEEVRQGIGTATSSEAAVQEESPEAKKQREEYEKQVAEVQAKNKKIEETNKIITASLQEGSRAFEAKNYDLAIAKYDEGISADPTFAGSAPVLLNNKAAALINRATDVYNRSVSADSTTKANALASAKKDLEEAIASAQKSLEILQGATSTDPAVQKNYEANRFSALTVRKNAFRLLAQTGADRNRGQEALKAFQEYMAVETDQQKKIKAQMDLALTLQDSNESELAIVEFEKVLADDPNNVDALVGIGLNMVNLGFLTMDSDPAKGKEQLQEAANYLQRFVDMAPDTHKFKADARNTIVMLKEEQKVTPQKGRTPTTTRRRN